MALIACPECGNQISTQAAVCPKCGAPIGVAGTIVPKRILSRSVAGLFALFLGGIGVNYFYLGRPVSGVLCLLFCWTLIPTFVGLLQGVYILSITDKHFINTYCV